MLGVFQHFLRQAGVLSIAFQFNHGFLLSGNVLLALRSLVHDVRELFKIFSRSMDIYREP